MLLCQKVKYFKNLRILLWRAQKEKRSKTSFLQKCITSTRDIVCVGSVKKLCKPLIFHTLNLHLLDKIGWNKLGNSMWLSIVEKARNSRVNFSDHFKYNGKTLEMHVTKILAPTNTMERVRNPCFSIKEYQFHASSMGSGLVGCVGFPLPKCENGQKTVFGMR